MLSAEASCCAALSLLSSLPFESGACVRRTCVGEDGSYTVFYVLRLGMVDLGA